ncbi:MAG: substrate-binding domain-containing protein [Vallitaleaceae bacterium]|nr:substrate-binding domain-containing protein [Vallitaleaceae bacterium]
MKKINLSIVLIGIILFMSAMMVYMLFSLRDGEKKKDQVYLVVKSTDESTDFWVNVVKGANVAATELGVEVIAVGPNSEIDIAQQIHIMEEIIEKKPEAIAIAACDYELLREVCEKAMKQGITLVTYDSDVNTKKKHSFVGTNSINAARRLAHEVGVQSKGQGQVAIISHVEGAFTAKERIEGFVRGLNSYPQMEVVGDIRYAKDSRQRAYENAIELIEQYPKLRVLYGTNEGSILGISDAIIEKGLKNEIYVVGFDMNLDIAQRIEEDVIDVIMVQRPFNMGYIAIREAIDVMNGKETENIDTSAVLINKENLFLPENQKLIVP